MTDIFDTVTTDDLPNDIKDFISHSTKRKIFLLFKSKSILTVDEIIVALYRKYKLIKNKPTVRLAIHNLCKSGKIKTLEPGLYELIKDVWGDLMNNRKIVDYKLIYGTHARETQEKVLYAITQGYEPYGSPFYRMIPDSTDDLSNWIGIESPARSYIYQAIVKYEDIQEKSTESIKNEIKDILNLEFDEFKYLTVRAANCLKSENIYKIKDIAKLRHPYDIQGCGSKTKFEISTVIIKLIVDKINELSGEQTVKC